MILFWSLDVNLQNVINIYRWIRRSLKYPTEISESRDVLTITYCTMIVHNNRYWRQLLTSLLTIESTKTTSMEDASTGVLENARNFSLNFHSIATSARSGHYVTWRPLSISGKMAKVHPPFLINYDTCCLHFLKTNKQNSDDYVNVKCSTCMKAESCQRYRPDDVLFHDDFLFRHDELTIFFYPARVVFFNERWICNMPWQDEKRHWRYKFRHDEIKYRAIDT